jgi:hypothetical protein
MMNFPARCFAEKRQRSFRGFSPEDKKTAFIPVILEAAVAGDILERIAISSQPRADGRFKKHFHLPTSSGSLF